MLQGGPGVIFSNGQLGATANFILRQGTADPHGDIGITTGTDHGYRVDGFYGGPLTQDWFVSIGGFYRNSDGVRDSQFPADDGGQLTGTLTHKWDQGKIMFFARVLDDKNLFVTDIPVSVSGSGKSQSVSAFPGFNANTGTFRRRPLRGLSVVEAPWPGPHYRRPRRRPWREPPHVRQRPRPAVHRQHRVQQQDDVQRGRGGLLLPVQQHLRRLEQLFDSDSWPGRWLRDQPTSMRTRLDPEGGGGPATGIGSATIVGSGAAVNPNAYVASMGFWIVQKHIQSFTDDMRFTFDLFEGNKLTVGGYWAAYSSDDHWWLGNNFLITATPNASPIDLTLNNGVNVTNNAGLMGSTFFALNENWNGRSTAVFLSDSWKMGQWLFDAGYRIEQQKDHGTIENDTATDLDNDPRNLYNKGVSVPNGTFTSGVSCETSGTKECTDFNHTLGSWSAGAKYELTPHMAVFGRINDGVHFPGFDDLRSGTPQTQTIHNYEVGYRAQGATIYGVVDLFRRQFHGVPFDQFTGTGAQDIPRRMAPPPTA